MMSALDEQRPKVGIAFLGDLQLRLTASRVAACRLQTDVAACIAALRETVRIFESQDKGERHQGTHAMNLSQQRNFWVGGLPRSMILPLYSRICSVGALMLFKTGSIEVLKAGLRSILASDLMILLLDPCSRSPFVFTSP
jgi:hypothetical protein